jgi:hypothetical protein
MLLRHGGPAAAAAAAITVESITESGNRTVRTLRDLESDPPYLDASLDDTYKAPCEIYLIPHLISGGLYESDGY